MRRAALIVIAIVLVFALWTVWYLINDLEEQRQLCAESGDQGGILIREPIGQYTCIDKGVVIYDS